MRRLAGLATALLACGGAGRPPEPGRPASPGSPPPAPAALAFADLAEASGLAAFGREAASAPDLLDVLAGGAAWVDHDRDGDIDACLTGPSGVALFRNDGGRFADVTAAAGLGTVRRALGVAVADADGDEDLVVANGHRHRAVDRLGRGLRIRQPPRLLRNDGGRFLPAGAEVGPGFGAARAGRGLAAGDHDRDGDVDFLIGTLDGPPALLVNRARRHHRVLEVRRLGPDRCLVALRDLGSARSPEARALRTIVKAWLKSG